ncbi:MAG: flagellar biosynthesis protein FliZ [Thermotogae bacterium]|nr:MAG: flagellar biosynthesis protein FliZ [Thermotogota bacterium]
MRLFRKSDRVKGGKSIETLIIQFSLALGILVVLLIVIYYFVTKRFPRKGSRNIKILDRKYIDRGTAIILVKILETYFFVLVAQNSAHVLKEVSEEEIGDLKEEVESFSSLFFKKLGKSSRRKD